MQISNDDATYAVFVLVGTGVMKEFAIQSEYRKGIFYRLFFFLQGMTILFFWPIFIPFYAGKIATKIIFKIDRDLDK